MALMSTLRHTSFLSFVVFVVDFLMYIFERWVRALCVCAFMTFKCHFKMKSSCQYAYYGFEYLPIPIWLVRFTNDIWYLCTFVRSFDERLDFTLDRFVFIYLLIERTNERANERTQQIKSEEEKDLNWVPLHMCLCMWNEAKSWIDLQNCVFALLRVAYVHICVFAEHFSIPLQQSKKTGFFSLIVLEF